LVKSCTKTHDKPLNNVIQFIDKEIIKTDTLIKTKTVLRNKEVEKLVPYQHIVYVPNKELCQDTTKLDSLKTLTLSQSKIIKTDDSLFVLFNKNDLLHVKKDSLKDKYIDSLITQNKKHWIKPFIKGVGVGLFGGLIIGVVK
jgi:hypothetical protein